MAEKKTVGVLEIIEDVSDSRMDLELTNSNTTANKLLQYSMNPADVSGNSVDDFEEELLNVDNDERFDISVSSAIPENDLHDLSETKKMKIEETYTERENKPQKKVFLDSTDSSTNVETSELDTENETPEPEKIATVVIKKKIIKLSEISAKERLEMRAKKFGLSPLSTDIKKTALGVDAKKAARAERFGINSNWSNIQSEKVFQKTNTEVLKQRAERFGGSVSTIVLNVDNTDKLEKRRARFAIATNTNETVSNAEKAERRLKRFIQPVK